LISWRRLNILSLRRRGGCNLVERRLNSCLRRRNLSFWRLDSCLTLLKHIRLLWDKGRRRRKSCLPVLIKLLAHRRAPDHPVIHTLNMVRSPRGQSRDQDHALQAPG
jgi:hypothetical protein